MVLRTIGLVLESTGYSVSVAPSAEAALQLLESQSFDLLLIDCLANFQRVIDAAKRYNPKIRVAICTGDPELGSSSLVDVVLAKPLPPGALLDTASRLLLRSRVA